MYGKGAVVEEVGRPLDQLQAVQEIEAGLPVGKVYCEHGTVGPAELPLCKLVERIVLEPEVGNFVHGRDFPQASCDFEGVGGFEAVPGVEVLQPEGLHISRVRRHIGPEVEYHFLHRLAEALAFAVGHYEAPYGGGAAGEVLGAGDYFYVHAQFACAEAGERDHGGVCYQRHPGFVCER